LKRESYLNTFVCCNL